MDTLLAIAEHDDAEAELEGENLLTPAGGPLNYDMKWFDKTYCEKLSRLTLSKNRYIALLTSLHMEFLYGREAMNNPEARGFLKQQATLRKEWRSELKISKEESLRTTSWNGATPAPSYFARITFKLKNDNLRLVLILIKKISPRKNK